MEKQKAIRLWLAGIALTLCAMCGSVKVQAQTIYDSPYVSFAPDGKAWTTNAHDTDVRWYTKGTTVYTDIASHIRALEAGEHYYYYARNGRIPIGKWEVADMGVNCCHMNYPPVSQPYYHGIAYVRNNCFRRHYSGWNAYCADCGSVIERANIYMSREAAESLTYFDIYSWLDFYYLCPFCNNLEQGVGFEDHICKAISANQYRVCYDANSAGAYGGYMADSYHMYNNATEYEGKPVTPITHLTRNAYFRTGYEFVGWNTEADGSGQAFADEAEIRNLTAYDCKEGGTVLLYAQWRKSVSVLQLDAGEGSYHGKAGITSVTQEYLSSYRVDDSLVKAPAGHTVTFQTNGGSAISPITGTGYLEEWILSNPFHGSFSRGVYRFLGADGATDILTASYGWNAIILPEPRKEGSSFGGWYFDEELTEPAGASGDSILPTEDIILYAGWVDLKLFSEDNYYANDGKGAVNLSWTQSDRNQKAYKLYQSKDNQTWQLITSASDVGKLQTVDWSFAYTGSTKTYTVPYSGVYTLTAYGAQGSDYHTHKGGYGGCVSAKLWLQEGEKITYIIGGSNGYNGGGAGTVYGNGGGATTILSDRQGTLMVAGGGGSASASGDGGLGGSAVSLRQDNRGNGVAGQAGGGGGHVGGNAGELITHRHINTCYTALVKDVVGDANRGIISYSTIEDPRFFVGISSDGSPSYGVYKKIAYGTPANPIPVDGCTTLTFQGRAEWTDGNGENYFDMNKGFRVYNQNGALIYQRSYRDIQTELSADYARAINASAPYNWYSLLPGYSYVGKDQRDYDNINHTEYVEACYLTYDSAGNVYKHYDKKNTGKGSEAQSWYHPSHYASFNRPELVKISTQWWGTYTAVFRDTVPIPAGTTAIYTEFDISGRAMSYENLSTGSMVLSGGRKAICGYTEGQVVSGKPAYGGSSYVKTEAVYEYAKQAGVRSGNGGFRIQSVAVGFQEELSLADVVATDFAKPDAISEKKVRREALRNGKINISWQEPRDNGTDYYHVAESYLRGSGTVLCKSNVTKNTLVSGIRGYYYVLDAKPLTTVTERNAGLLTESHMAVTVNTTVQYLHVAALDKAGNIGATVHLRIDAGATLWKLYTKQLELEKGDNVYSAGSPNTWYVRADGVTPFTLRNECYLDGIASKAYQPNYLIYESVTDGMTAKNIYFTPSSDLSEAEHKTEAADMEYSTEGRPVLTPFSYYYTVRSERNTKLSGVHQFTLEQTLSGQTITVFPGAGVRYGKQEVFSDHTLDSANGLTLIADGEAPVIAGMEVLEQKELINKRDGTLALRVTALDALSGVAEFYLKITNADNGSYETYLPGEDGSIQVNITMDEPLFSGDFQVTAYARDYVGNESKIVQGTTEFGLYTRVERILEPHEPVFAGGESGILHIVTYGYADRVEVEFPEALAVLNPELNMVFRYEEKRDYAREEQVQFMIPLKAPADVNYTITVRAYKEDKHLEDYPSLSTISVEGSVLDELRTRLR